VNSAPFACDAARLTVVEILTYAGCADPGDYAISYYDSLDRPCVLTFGAASLTVFDGMQIEVRPAAGHHLKNGHAVRLLRRSNGAIAPDAVGPTQ
jgi:hypothetical protein